MTQKAKFILVGLAGVVKGLGILSMKNFGIMDTLKAAVEDKRDASIRARACATRRSRSGSRLCGPGGGAICGTWPGRGGLRKLCATCRANAAPWRARNRSQ